MLVPQSSNTPFAYGQCKSCPLKDRPRVIGRGKKYGLLIVGDQPDFYAVSHSTPLVGKQGHLLREALRGTDVNTEMIYVTYATMCSAKNPGETLNWDAVECCHERLLAEIKHHHPSAIITLGRDAFEALRPSLDCEWVPGKWFKASFTKTPILAIIHPKDVVSDPTKLSDLLNQLDQLHHFPTEAWKDATTPDYVVIHDTYTLAGLVRNLQGKAYKYGVCDIETTGLDALTDQITCVGIGFADEWFFEKRYFVIEPEAWKSAAGHALLSALLNDASIARIWAGHNAYQFDRKFLNQAGIPWEPKFDTMLAHYTLDERQAGHRLKTIASRYFWVKDWSLLDPSCADVEALYPYLAKDILYTLCLVPILEREMELEGIKGVHDELLIPAARALAAIESRGAAIDVEYLYAKGSELAETLRDIARRIETAAGIKSFNPNSSAAVKWLLYDELHIPTVDRKADRLTLMNIDHPVVKDIIQYRLVHRLINVFIRKLITYTREDGRIYGHFLLFGTVTGRLSSRQPNLQNMPVVAGPDIRNAYVAAPGWKLIEADYSQLELRVAAMLSGDQRLVDIYSGGGDAHIEVATEIFRLPREKINERQRYIAKHISFGILYGRGAKSLALSALSCSPGEAQAYINSYFKRFRGVWQWMRKQQHEAFRHGFVQTPFGRKRRFPPTLSEDRRDIERQAANAPIQSTASDICLGALVRLENRLPHDRCRIVLTAHDSILFEVKPDYLEEAAGIIKEEMEDNVPLDTKIPFSASFKIGDRWGDLKDWSP